ncbi:hypothetical protein FRB96_009361 [Tulasnella sp. 330]|nr:hypothetical protein FRB96_009361 [Tulasnella sp. 330]KAG8884435.1 hypothetical protein FRB98_002407 [Tulasnella sp. 332]
MRPALHRALRCLVHPLPSPIRFTLRHAATAHAIVQTHVEESESVSDTDPEPRRSPAPRPIWPPPNRRKPDLGPSPKSSPSISETARYIRALRDEEGNSYIRRQDLFDKTHRVLTSPVESPLNQYLHTDQHAASTNITQPQHSAISKPDSAVLTGDLDYDRLKAPGDWDVPRSRTDTPFYDVDWRPLIGSHTPDRGKPKYLELTLVRDPVGLPHSIYCTIFHLGFRYENQTMVHRLSPKLRKQLRRVQSLLFIRPMSKTKMRYAMVMKKTASARRRIIYEFSEARGAPIKPAAPSRKTTAKKCSRPVQSTQPAAPNISKDRITTKDARPNKGKLRASIDRQEQ